MLVSRLRSIGCGCIFDAVKQTIRSTLILAVSNYMQSGPIWVNSDNPVLHSVTSLVLKITILLSDLNETLSLSPINYIHKSKKIIICPNKH